MRRTQLSLGLGAAAVTSLAFLLAGLLLAWQLERRDEEILRASLENRAHLVAALVESGSSGAADTERLERLAKRAASASRARVTLIDASGRVVADSDVPTRELASLQNHAGRPEVAAALAGSIGSDTRLSRSVGRPLRYLAVPLRDGGAVRVAADPAGNAAGVPPLARILLSAGALGLLLAVLLGVAAAAFPLRPLSQLREVLVGLAQGDLGRRLPWHGRDELGDIARVINRMAEELRDRIRDLTAEKEQLRAVLQGMVEGVLVLDREGRTLLANPRLRDLFGIWGKVAGRPALEVIRRTDVEQALNDAAEHSEPVVLEIAIGPEKRALQMHAGRFPAHGELLGVVAVFHDVTELRRLERMRSEFVANVSHELKTPLTAIRGFAETLQAEGLTPEQRAQYLGVVLRHAERLSALIDDLLELSRIEGRQAPLRLDEVDLAGLLESMLRDMRPRLESRDLDARMEPGPRPRIQSDRRALEQVLQNLLDNAIKYTDPGGRIRMRISEEAERVRIEVADDGIGIPEVDQARIFERFYRVNKVRSRDLGGTGLGLSIVKHLVQALRGEIFLESVEGKGSTFSILLPRRSGS